MNHLNNSLTKFSGFITWAMALGSLGLFASFLMIINTGSDSTIVQLGAFVAYASSAAIGLSVVGVFLRQTALVIVEGISSAPERVGYEDLSFSSGFEPLGDAEAHNLRVERLTIFQHKDWKDAGKPDLSDWDGSIKFTTWLRAQKDNNAAESGR